EGKRIVNESAQEQNQHKNRLAPEIEQQARDQQYPFPGERADCQQIERISGAEECCKCRFVKEHRLLGEWDGPRVRWVGSSLHLAGSRSRDFGTKATLESLDF